jgi:hypothetical protein
VTKDHITFRMKENDDLVGAGLEELINSVVKILQ